MDPILPVGTPPEAERPIKAPDHGSPLSVDETLAQLESASPSLAVAMRALMRSARRSSAGDGGAPMRELIAGFRDLTPAAIDPALRESTWSDDAVHAHLRDVILPTLERDGLVLLPPAGVAAVDAHVRLSPALWRAVEQWGPLDDANAESNAAAAATPPVIQQGSELAAKGLVKVYRGRKVVNDVALRLRQGEIVGLLGPNGAGKTTTFYMIVGLIAPQRGVITLDGEDITSTPMYRRAQRGIGYLAQEPSIFRKLTVEENILAILETLKLTAAERSARLETLLDELHIKHLRRSKAYQLSGGERRRLEITRALVTEPKFMMLDEPFAGVDPKAVDDIQKIVAQLRYRGIGVLISDHNVEQTLDIVDRAYIMYDGQVRVAGTVRELVFDDTVSEFYLGPTLTERLRERYRETSPEVTV